MVSTVKEYSFDFEDFAIISRFESDSTQKSENKITVYMNDIIKFSKVLEENNLKMIVAKKEKLNNVKEMAPCIACEGAKVSKKNTICKKCDGTGEMSASLFKEYNKEMEKILMGTGSKDMKKGRIKDVLESGIYSGNNKVCISCKEKISINEVIYTCNICDGMTFCEECECIIEHGHALIKAINEGGINSYKAKITPLSSKKDMVERGKELCKVFRVKNMGKRKWDKHTSILPIEDNVYKAFVNKASSIQIGELEPGKAVNVVLRLTASYKLGDCTMKYKIVINDEDMGCILRIHMQVCESFNDCDPIAKLCKNLRASGKLSEEMVSNFMCLLQIFGGDSMNLLKILKENDNNLNAVIKELLF